MNRTEFTALLGKQVGKRYIFGFEVKMSDPNPKAFDCSELVQWAYHRAGADIVDGSFNQYDACEPVKGNPKIGDLFFLKNKSGRVHHVGIYVGNDMCIEAKGRAWGVIRSTLDNVNKRGAIWRRYPKLKLTTPQPVRTTAKRVKLDDHHSTLRVRKSASLTGKVVGHLTHGTPVSVLGKVGRFYHISKPVSGFVYAAKIV